MNEHVNDYTLIRFMIRFERKFPIRRSLLLSVGVTVRYRKGRYRKCLYCHVMYKLLYPSIMVRTSPLVSVRVRTRVSVSFSFTVLHVSRGLLR